MTRRTQGLGSFFAAIGVLVLIAGTVAFGWAASLTNGTARGAAAPTATDTSDYWAQQLDTARVELEANTTALHAAALTGQPVTRLNAQCLAAVADFNQAAPHLNTAPINASKECTP